MAIRSGRFEVTATTAAPTIEIVRGRGDAIYRILNSGAVEFKVLTKKSGSGNHELELDPGYSIDVSTKENIQIKGEDGQRITGIYDFLDSYREVRSGRFEYTGSSHTIVDLTDGSITAVHYRVFNSGDCEFDVEIVKRAGGGGPPAPVSVPVGQSRDFSVPNSHPVLKVKPKASNVTVKGVYDLLAID